MLRLPYKKSKFPYNHKIQGPFDNLQEDIDILFDTFLENLNAYKSGEIPMFVEENFNILGVPGPSQYRAFYEFFKLLRDGEFSVLEQPYFFINDLDSCKNDKHYESPMLEFVKNIRNYDFGRQKKEIVFACGSFFKDYPNARKKMIKYFNFLKEERKINIHLYTQAEREEEHNKLINNEIKEIAKFGIKKRIPIHYVRCGDLTLIEFPHTEQTRVRLTWLLDINKLDFKSDKTKNDFIQFFDNLIYKVLK